MEITIFKCSMCGKTFEDQGENQKECLVGGHWTPHSSTDKPPESILPMRCCHQFQKEVSVP